MFFPDGLWGRSFLHQFQNIFHPFIIPQNQQGNIMLCRNEVRGALLYLLIVIATYFFFQTVIVITHEHIHSTTAFLLGNMQNPLAIEWGNPITLSGWDEGVSYSSLFASGLGVHAAVIAVMPLIFHAVVVTCGIFILKSGAFVRRKWAFHLIFWFIIVNLAELIAYMPMRAFSSHGDIGNINHGLGISPWPAAVLGTAFVLIWLWYLLRYVLPGMNAVVTSGSGLSKYVTLIVMAFFLFLFSGGIRLAEANDWVMGTIAFLAFFLVLWFCRPEMSWVIAAEEAALM